MGLISELIEALAGDIIFNQRLKTAKLLHFQLCATILLLTLFLNFNIVHINRVCVFVLANPFALKDIFSCIPHVQSHTIVVYLDVAMD